MGIYCCRLRGSNTAITFKGQYEAGKKSFSVKDLNKFLPTLRPLWFNYPRLLFNVMLIKELKQGICISSKWGAHKAEDKYPAAHLGWKWLPHVRGYELFTNFTVWSYCRQSFSWFNRHQTQTSPVASRRMPTSTKQWGPSSVKRNRLLSLLYGHACHFVFEFLPKRMDVPKKVS